MVIFTVYDRIIACVLHHCLGARYWASKDRFYTDGIIEAENEMEEIYGTERLEKTLSGIDSAMGSNEVIEAILKDVTGFTGSAEQYDDMTIVVTRKL
jgi:serine phosphatase RsbU (regulator of sigma subunit)